MKKINRFGRKTKVRPNSLLEDDPNTVSVLTILF